MALEQHDRKTGHTKAKGEAPKVSLRKSGSIGINKHALQQFFADCNAVILYYDPEQNNIGIEPIEELHDHPNTYKITRRNPNAGGTVTPKSFLAEYDLQHSETLHYSVEWDNDRELLIVNLDQEMTKYGSKIIQDSQIPESGV